jgi:hypothetical protein
MVKPAQHLGYSLIFVEIITMKPAQNKNYQADQSSSDKNLQDQIPPRSATMPTSVVIIQILSPVFRAHLLLRKRSPGIPRNRTLLAAYGDDKEFALRSNERCAVTVQKLTKQDLGHFSLPP